MQMRIGIGNDIHRLESGNGIRLGGLFIPCPFSCRARSDGDVLLHALTDAMLGALAEGDIGDRYPESAVRQGEDSRRFVLETLALLAARRARLVNIDCIIELERPRLAEWKEAIGQSLSDILSLPPDRIGVKAKTGEGLGPVGEGLAIAARAVALLSVEAPDA